MDKAQSLKRAQQRAESFKQEGDRCIRTFWLKDYTGPRSKYPYAELAGDLEACLAAGEDVYCLDVPRLSHIVCATQGLKIYERPWSDSGLRFYTSAADALAIRGGKRSPGALLRQE